MILELRVNFKLAQFCHRQTILSEIEFVFLCRFPCMDFLPPSGGVFRLSHLGIIAVYPMQTVMRFSRFNDRFETRLTHSWEIF